MWWTSELSRIIRSGMVQREEIVTIANLGVVHSGDEIGINI